MLLPLAGVLLSYRLYSRAKEHKKFPRAHDFVFSGWKFDWLYELLVIRPYVYVARINKTDFVDSAYDGLADSVVRLHFLLASTQSGLMRAYLMSVVLGAIVFLGVMVAL